MPRLFVGNFDFEYTLSAGSASASATARRVSASLAAVWVSIAGPGDYVLSNSPVSNDDLRDVQALGAGLPRFVQDLEEVDSGPKVELVPWGWTNALVDLAQLRGWRCEAPDPPLVRQVNSRSFRLALEVELQVAPEGTAVVRSLDELRAAVAAVARSSRGYRLKAEFGMSGRESMRGSGSVLNEAALRWAQRRLVGVGAIVVEPELNRLAEAGVQFEIPRTGAPRLVGVAPLLVDANGTYRGSRIGPSPADICWRPAVDVGFEVARRLAARGYSGPLGIDSMLYRDEAGETRLRPLGDLNARYTMGRLALGFERLLAPGWCASWLHLEWPLLGGVSPCEVVVERLNRSSFGMAQVVETSPRRGAGSRRSILVLASTSDVRAQLEGALFAAAGAKRPAESPASDTRARHVR